MTPSHKHRQSKKAPNKEARSGIIYYIIFLLSWTAIAIFASQLIIGFIMSLLLGDKLLLPVWMSIYDLLVYAFVLFLVAFMPPIILKQIQKNHPSERISKLVKDLQIQPTEMGVNHYPTFTDLGLAPVGYIVYIFIANILTNIMRIFPWFNANDAQNVGFNILNPGFDYIAAMIALVFIAPIIEELVMRGWLYGKIRSKLDPIKTSLLVSLLFALLHGQWNVGVSVFGLSLVLCALREITGSIWSGILLHMLNNGIAFYILYILGGI